MENINHPSHYQGKYEVIDIIEDKDWGEGFNRGNSIKYILRAGKKDPNKEIEDLEKARWYLDREIRRLRAATSEEWDIKYNSGSETKWPTATEIGEILDKVAERTWKMGAEVK